MARAIDKQTMLDLIIEAKRMDPETGSFSEWLAEYLAEHLPALTPPNEWISVEERLPEPDFPGQQRGFYLVTLSNGTVKELMYEFRHYENMMFDVGWHETAYPVTHWMLLPAPPDRRPPKEELKDASD